MYSLSGYFNGKPKMRVYRQTICGLAGETISILIEPTNELAISDLSPHRACSGGSNLELLLNSNALPPTSKCCSRQREFVLQSFV